MRKIKAAIVGAGFIGKAHLEAVRRLGYVDVVAVGQDGLEKARKNADMLGIPKAYGHYEELLGDEEIEVVHNCTPNHLHYEINRQALLRGKHLLAEKPLTLKSGESAELARLAERTGLIAAVNFNYRQFPMVQQLKAIVQAAELGRIPVVRGSYLQDWLLYETDYNWRLEPEFGGQARAIGDIGSHLFDLAQYVTGLAIEEVMADTSVVIPTRYRKPERRTAGEEAEQAAEPVRMTTEDYCSVLVKFEGGARGVFTVSQVAAGRKNALELHLDGSLASGSWKQEEPFRLQLGYRDKPVETILRDPEMLKREAIPYVHYPGGHEEGWADGLKNMMACFYEAVAYGRRPDASVATFREGHRIMLVNDAVLRSAASGRWERVGP